MTTVINAIPEYVLTAVISTVFIFIIKAVHMYLHEKALHAKTAQSKELWSFMDQVADSAVSSLVGANKSGDEKFAEATQIVQQALKSQGFTSINAQAIETAVQSAYEKSSLTSSNSQMKWLDGGLVSEKVSSEPDGTAVAIDPAKEAK
jgi:hypothetical protein